MTGITNIRGWNMVSALATGHSAVMTIETGTHDLRMIYRSGVYRRPGRREFLVTGIAYVT